MSTAPMMDPIFPKDLNRHLTSVNDHRQRLYLELWKSQRLPEQGWKEAQLEDLLQWFASLDSNNRLEPACIGAGEREGRVACPLVSRLHAHLSHGMGRSGNLTEVQPKALGSSMLASLANELTLSAIQLRIPSCRGAMVVPMATGMALALVLLAWKQQRSTAKRVIWSRIDQKSALKAILLAGMEPIVIDTVTSGREGDDSLCTDLDAIERALRDSSSGEILCVISTTSCFAPRQPEMLAEIGELCTRYSTLHLVNNAYGLQSQHICGLLASARVDCFVQSCDKNFQVPVGGAVIATFKRHKLDCIANAYPGRASLIPSRDMLLTLLHLGSKGLEAQWEAREITFTRLESELLELAEELGERVLNVPTNEVSLAMTLSQVPKEKTTLLGSMLFARGVTGARVVVHSGAVKEIGGVKMVSFGSHYSHRHEPYLNVAGAIGMTMMEVDKLIGLIRRVYNDCVGVSHS